MNAMTDLTINNMLSLLQNTPVSQQQVGSADVNDDAAQSTTATPDSGQNLPTDEATSAAAPTTNGSATAQISPDMTALLLQMQESQEMMDAQSLLYGDASGDGSDPLASILNSLETSAPTTAQSTSQPTAQDTSPTTAAETSIMSSNQSLLDYLNALTAADTTTTDGTFTGTNDGSGDALLGVNLSS
jgi:hypothetical protein